MVHPSRAEVPEIRDVWEDNLEEEMGVLRGMIERYPYVAMVSEA